MLSNTNDVYKKKIISFLCTVQKKIHSIFSFWYHNSTYL